MSIGPSLPCSILRSFHTVLDGEAGFIMIYAKSYRWHSFFVYVTVMLITLNSFYAFVFLGPWANVLVNVYVVPSLGTCLLLFIILNVI